MTRSLFVWNSKTEKNFMNVKRNLIHKKNWHCDILNQWKTRSIRLNPVYTVRWREMKHKRTNTEHLILCVIAKILTYMVNIYIRKFKGNDRWSFIYLECTFFGSICSDNKNSVFFSRLLYDLIIWFPDRSRYLSSFLLLSSLLLSYKTMRIKLLFQVCKCGEQMALHLG